MGTTLCPSVCVCWSKKGSGHPKLYFKTRDHGLGNSHVAIGETHVASDAVLSPNQRKDGVPIHNKHTDPPKLATLLATMVISHGPWNH